MTHLGKYDSKSGSNALFPDEDFMQVGLASILPDSAMVKHWIEWHFGPAICRPSELFLIEKLVFHNLGKEILVYNFLR